MNRKEAEEESKIQREREGSQCAEALSLLCAAE